MNKIFKMLMVLTISGSLAACGGSGGGGTTTGDSTGGTPGTVAKVDGSYTGTYTTSSITSSTPYSLVLEQNGSDLTGTFSSTKISGTVTGTVASDKTITMTVAEPSGLGNVSVVMSPVGDTWRISSVSGTDVFGTHASGAGNVSKILTPITSVFANGYNGYADIRNTSGTSTQPVGNSSGVYPISISNLLPDGANGWSGQVDNLFISGLLTISYLPSGSIYTGIMYPGGTSYKWALGNGGFVLSDLSNRMYMYRVDPNTSTYIDTASMTLYPGALDKTLPGTWTYTNPNSTAAGVVSMSLTINPTNGRNYSATVSATIRHTDGSQTVDTVNGTVVGNYTTARFLSPNTGTKVYQMKFGPGALSISNPTGSTSGLGVYVDYANNSTSPMRLAVAVDTGSAAFPITLTK